MIVGSFYNLQEKVKSSCSTWEIEVNRLGIFRY